MTTPSLQTSYTDGSTNTIRPLSRTYPDGRAVGDDYGAAGDLGGHASRIAALVDDDETSLAEYDYLGLGAVVQQDSPEPDLRSTLVSLTGGNDPDTGDIYSGLDRFGRVKDVRWRNVSGASDLSRIQYGYDRASNRLWRQNPSDAASQHDWLYSYDGLQRLKDAQRGTLHSGHTGIASPQFTQCWTLDAVGNWQGFRQTHGGGDPWELVQARQANAVNEITGIANTAGPAWAQPAYDPAGNMTTIPWSRPGTGSGGWYGLSVDDWSSLTVDGWATLPVDGSGPLTPDSRLTAVYDAWNRLVQLVDPDNGHNLTVFDPDFGLRLTSGFDWETAYAGYRFDAATGLYVVRFRILIPWLGWAQRDPIGYVGEGRYQYGSGVPLDVVDDFGLQPARPLPFEPEQPPQLRLWPPPSETPAPAPLPGISPMLGGAALAPLIVLAFPTPLANSEPKPFPLPLPDPFPLPTKERNRRACWLRHPTWPSCADRSRMNPLNVANTFLQQPCPQLFASGFTRIDTPGMSREAQRLCESGSGIQVHVSLTAWVAPYDPSYTVSVRCCTCCRGTMHESYESYSCSAPHWSSTNPTPRPPICCP